MNKKSIRKIIIGILLCLVINVVYELHCEIPVLADTVVVNATNVNVRSEPNTKSKSYGKVSKGNTLERTEERSDGWSCIKYGDKTAYIKSEFLISSTTAAAAVAVPAIGGGSASAAQSAKPSTDYIANTNTGKFHYPGCSSVKKMSEKNKLYFSGSRDELISKGYVPCKRCNP